MNRSINPEQVEQALTDGREFALLDVRERGQYARGHLFLAINLPLSHLELRLNRYVTRLSTRVILCDDGNRYAERASAVMVAAGYTDVRIIEGGVSACRDYGLELFRGHYAVTYAFGLYVAEHWRTPQLSPLALSKKLAHGEPVLLLDSRNEDEFRNASIPGAINLPLSELSYQIKDLAPDPNTEIVVNCGAVTRGVLGCQWLIDAGVPNPVAVLTNGVRGWDLSDLDLNHGVEQSAMQVSIHASGWAADSAMALADKEGVQFVEIEQVESWRNDSERTLFLVDVRTRAEYERGHLPGSVWILGGELIGLYEDHIGTLNARFCLVDDNGARAIVTAVWLKRMGWPDVSVLKGSLGSHQLTSGTEDQHVPASDPAVDLMNPDELVEEIQSGNPLVLDFASSNTYGHGHIPGSWWALRSALLDNITKLPAAEKIVTTCPDGQLSALAAMDLSKLTSLPVYLLRGGTKAWIDAGHDLVPGFTRLLGEMDDVSAEFALRPNDDRVTTRAAQRRMVDWQEELLEKVARDRTFAFPLPPKQV